ncbi:MAG: TonB-dependent receptor [Parvularculaceae bacterium]|nr:TonB-dependent receptor [Parvularculaceae bacterium]
MLISLLCATSALSPVSLAAATTALPQVDGDAIVVTASPISKPASQLVTPVSVLEGEDLQRQLRASLGETLRLQPGVSTTSYAPGASRPIIRGLGGDRVRTLTNGIGSIDAASASPDHAVPIEPALAERIEIVRGSQVLRYGSSANGGVVNVLDGRIPSEAPEDGYELAARTAYTTVDEGLEGSVAGAILLGKFGGYDVVATGSYAARDASDYDIPGFAESAILRSMEEEEHDHEEEGEEHEDEHDHDEEEEVRDTLENSFVESQSYSGGLSFIGEKGFLGFSIQRNETEYGLPGGHEHGHEEEHEEEGEEHDEEEHGEEEEGVFVDLEQTRFDINGSVTTGGFIDRIDLYAGFVDYEHLEFEAPGEPGTEFANEGVEVRVEAVQGQNGNWRGASGFQFRSREFSAIGEEAFVTPSDTDQIGLFTFQELVLGESTLEAAVRFESTDQSNTTLGIDRTFSTFSGSVGGTFALAEDARLSGSIFRTERAPTAEELFSNGPHLATGAFEIGDVNLDAEEALGAEIGIRFDLDRVQIGLAAFHTDYTGFIYEEATGETGADILIARGEDDEEELEEFGELDAFQYVQEDATFSGFEIEASADLGEMNGIAFSSDLVVDYVNASLSGGGNLPRIPPLGVVAGIEADAAFGSFRAEVEHSAEADDVADFELPTDSFTLVNLYADWNVLPNLTLQVSALNLTDEEARVHTSFTKDEVPLPGRNFRFSARYQF